MDDLLSYHRQFVENNRRSLEQKIKEKEKEVLCQLHDLLTGDLPCDQINQDLQQANDALRAELDKEMEEKKHLCFQSDQQLQKIHQLEAELKTARDLLKESQNYAEEMKTWDPLSSREGDPHFRSQWSGNCACLFIRSRTQALPRKGVWSLLPLSIRLLSIEGLKSTLDSVCPEQRHIRIPFITG
ncbi:uncharacterized protein ACDP82_003888 [Pangshura tecta]